MSAKQLAKRPLTKKKASKLNTVLTKLQTSKMAAAAFVIVFAGIGSYLLFSAHAAVNGFVYAQGTKLYLNGGEYKFTGVNAYHLTTDYTINYGCGETNSQTDVDNFFASLRPNSMVRVWAFQQIGWDKNTNSLDFALIDRVVKSAEAHNQKLILTLGDQWGPGCGEVRKTEAWYGGGYRTVVTNGSAIDVATVKLSYWDYLDRIIPRYANSPAIGMWEPINEPASDDGSNNCSSTAPVTLRSFFDAVGGKIHSLDPSHLISSGLQGSGQCGTRGSEYQTLHQSPGIDIASYHDYGQDDQPMPGDQWNGLQVRLNQMAAVGKPLFVGEAGIKARDNVSGCLTTAQRRDKMKVKMDTQFPAGVVGFVPWVWVKPNTRTECLDNNYSFDIEAGQDVMLTLIHDYPLPGGGTLSDNQPPAQPASLSAVPQSSAQINLSWSPSTDNIGVTGYDVYRNNAKVSTSATNSFSDVGLTAGTAYSYYIIARDAAGNSSPASETVNTATPAPPPIAVDTTAPVATITSPINGSTIGNSVSVKATATDNTKVTKLEIYIDGSLKTSNTNNTSISYSWNSKKIARGYHTITTKAYDAAGNAGQATVTVIK